MTNRYTVVYCIVDIGAAQYTENKEVKVMGFSCGCEVSAGEAIPYETIRKHYKHTIEALVFWELILRKGGELPELRLKLSQARIDLLNCIEEMFPEVKEE